MKPKYTKILTTVTATSLALVFSTTAMAAGTQPQPESIGISTTIVANSLVSTRLTTNIGDVTEAVDSAIDALSTSKQSILSDEIEAFDDSIAALNATTSADSDTLFTLYKKIISAIADLMEKARQNDIRLNIADDTLQSIFEDTMAVGVADTTLVEDAIDNLDDNEQETLSDYIDALQIAVDARQDAVSDGEEDLTAYNDAISDALITLYQAAVDADIDIFLPEPPTDYWYYNDYMPQTPPEANDLPPVPNGQPNKNPNENPSEIGPAPGSDTTPPEVVPGDDAYQEPVVNPPEVNPGDDESIPEIGENAPEGQPEDNGHFPGGMMPPEELPMEEETSQS